VPKIKNFEYLKELLEKEVLKRNTFEELSLQKPDPLFVARQYNDEYVALICALFAYGNAKQILLFLSKLDFSLLDTNPCEIEVKLQDTYYRFQNTKDIQEVFKTLHLVKKEGSLENIFLQGYKKNHDVIEGLKVLLEFFYEINPYRSRGYEFLLGKIPTKMQSPYKRWNMFFRWMVRKDKLDLGLWTKVDKKDLLLPLDTHTFRVGRHLGLVKRKTYDFSAVLEITQNLRKFDPSDPVKYDFALYRIGQERIYNGLKI
jgi:uncharacterized protein (TIGR02757 family)